MAYLLGPGNYVKWAVSLVAILTSAAQGTINTEINWQTAVSLNNYKSYSSISLVQYEVPIQALTTSWYFITGRSLEKCERRTAIIFIQQGSFPVINPLNETFPDRFNLHRSHLKLLTIQANESSLLYEINHPLPGSWFAAAFLGDYVDDRLTVKGLEADCDYSLTANHLVKAKDNIDELTVGTSHKLNLSSWDQHFFRFHTSELTWRYAIDITSCSNLTAADEDNGTNTTVPCPMRVASRGLALPVWAGNETHVQDCSNQSERCTLPVGDPATDAWHYLEVEVHLVGHVSFDLVISLEECRRYGMDEDSQTERGNVDPMLGVLSGDVLSRDDPIKVPANTNTTARNTTSDPAIKSTGDALGSNGTPPQTVRFNTSVPEDLAINATGTPPNTSSTSHGKSSWENVPQPQNNTGLNPPEVTNDTCLRMPSLGKYSMAQRPFQSRFNIRIGVVPVTNRLYVPEQQPMVLKFELLPLQDSGGTLKYAMALELQYLRTSQIVRVFSCIQKDIIPIDEQGVRCHDDNHQVVSNQVEEEDEEEGKDDYSKLYFPYPEPGSWYISLLTKCYRNSTNSSVSLVAEPCHDDVMVTFLLGVYPCLDGGCGEYGTCREYYSGVLHFSSCRCAAYYRGYACNDDTVAQTDREQLRATLLLSLSNLAFLPGIVLATYRRFYVEALVYFYTMFFSTFYHACDGDRKYLLCIMPYNVLAHCDFFGSIMSFWVTLIAMARLPDHVRAVTYMVAALGLAMGVTWDRFNLWTFLVPCLVGIVIMAAFWARRCHVRHQCYPGKLRWVAWLLPGTLIALAGLVIFAFFETETNYMYTHSAWHACIALCIIFFLPPREARKTEMHREHDEDTDLEVTVIKSEAGAFFNTNVLAGEGATIANGHVDDQSTSPAKEAIVILGADGDTAKVKIL